MSLLPDDQRTIAGGFELAIQLTDKRQFRMTGHVYSDDDASQINQRVDTFQRVLDRQAVRADLVAKRAERASWIANLQSQKDAYEGLAEMQQKGKLTSTQKQALANYDPNVKHCNAKIDELTATIEAGEKELATT